MIGLEIFVQSQMHSTTPKPARCVMMHDEVIGIKHGGGKWFLPHLQAFAGCVFSMLKSWS